MSSHDEPDNGQDQSKSSNTSNLDELAEEDRVRLKQSIHTHREKPVLERLYWEYGYSQTEIGEMFGLTGASISYWMRKHGIGTRVNHGGFDIPHREEKAEYGRIRIPPAEEDAVHRYEVKEHQLIALLNGESREKVLDDEGTHVIHHRLPTKVAINLPEVVEVVTPAEHKAITHPRDLPDDVEHWEADTASTLEEIDFERSGVPVDAVKGLHRSRLNPSDPEAAGESPQAAEADD